ncbi:acyltransferase family protein [Leptospira yasudae]|uniref:acyltransferase family protein n=1 Tax=Leptospira yasudae TaxID=2202201 RepID=UPI0010914D07|nr:acyltransferase [Leptospira yasudae]MBW0435951.1 acyltransferase [Leptospira yasudae]TGM96924.1 acyltransferase [Leptospira yasudae]
MFKALRYYFFGIFQSDPREISSLNGIRCLGFFLLVLGHLYVGFEPFIRDKSWIMRNLLYSTSQCMDIFFVLSGFLISGPLFKEIENKNTIQLGKFFSKRTLRIFPPYFAFLFFQTFIIAPLLIKVQPEYADYVRGLQSKVIYDFLYVSNYVMGTMPHGWSLSLEEQFYLLFPIFLLLIFRKIPKRYRIHTLTAFITVPILYRMIVYYTVIEPAPSELTRKLYLETIYYPLQGRLDCLYTGILLAYVYNTYPKEIENFLYDKKKFVTALIFAAASLVCISLFVCEYDKGLFSMVFRFNINSIAWATIALLSMKERTWLHRIFSWKIFSPVAKLTYCTYLIHFFFQGILAPAFINAREAKYSDLLLFTVPIGIVLLFLGYLFHLITERPFMLIKEKWFGKSVDMQPSLRNLKS